MALKAKDEKLKLGYLKKNSTMKNYGEIVELNQ